MSSMQLILTLSSPWSECSLQYIASILYQSSELHLIYTLYISICLNIFIKARKTVTFNKLSFTKNRKFFQSETARVCLSCRERTCMCVCFRRCCCVLAPVAQSGRCSNKGSLSNPAAAAVLKDTPRAAWIKYATAGFNTAL